MNIKKHIPNLFTLANLVCGVMAIMLFNSPKSCHGNDNIINLGIIFILIATVFDFLDGFMAKLLKAHSPLGAQLDSFADMVTFGVAPCFLVMQAFGNTEPQWLPLVSFLIPIFSALRLAKFNIDTEQTTYFKGIPTPANAIFWCGLVMAMNSGLKLNIYIQVGLVIIMSLLMMSNMKMLSFKMKSLAFKGDNLYRYALIVGAPILGVVCYLLGNIFLAIPLIIILYILLSIPYHIFYKNETT